MWGRTSEPARRKPEKTMIIKVGDRVVVGGEVLTITHDDQEFTTGNRGPKVQGVEVDGFVITPAFVTTTRRQAFRAVDAQGDSWAVFAEDIQSVNGEVV